VLTISNQAGDVAYWHFAEFAATHHFRSLTEDGVEKVGPEGLQLFI
jgi:hypothetical protein